MKTLPIPEGVPHTRGTRHPDHPELFLLGKDSYVRKKDPRPYGFWATLEEFEDSARYKARWRRVNHAKSRALKRHLSHNYKSLDRVRRLLEAGKPLTYIATYLNLPMSHILKYQAILAAQHESP